MHVPEKLETGMVLPGYRKITIQAQPEQHWLAG
jgi:hypothetical protein